jgi:transposase InsO family protein
VKYAAIADWAGSGEYSVKFMCEQLGVSRSGYYKWRVAAPSALELEDAKLLALIKSMYARLNRPGVRRLWAELRVAGHRVGFKRILRLMRRLDIQGRHRKAYRRTTVQDGTAGDVPDLVGRDFTAKDRDSKWCGDITYVKTWQGWGYLATVIDLYSRKLVGWAVSDNMDSGLVVDALSMALKTRRPGKPVVFHSDRGSQYTSKRFADYCLMNNVVRSMGRTGVCFDNAVAESFNATFKRELIHTMPWPSVDHLRKKTFEWVEKHYNRTRRHSSLGYLTIAEYELGYREINEIATIQIAA